MPALTEQQLAFLQEPNYAVVATLDAKGRPRSTVVWVDTDGEAVRFNTTTKRAKARHLEGNPYVSVLVFDPHDAYRWLEVQGRAETTQEGADEHIRALSGKYTRQEYEARDRLLVRVRPERVNAYGV
jgi:PPOX class probable F420-dependent enzyme